MPFNSIFSWFIKKRIHQIDLFKKYPLDVQQEWFEKLITAGRKTVFGKKWCFHDVVDYQTFRSLVPLQGYEQVQPYTNQVMEGDSDVLWPGQTKWFAKSSGTTSSRVKLVPVTKESLMDCHYKGGKDLLALYYHNYPNRKLYKGKHLIIGGSARINQLSADSYFGDLSAIIVKNLPWWAEIRRTPAKKIALMSEWEEKIEKMALETIKDDVYILAGVPSWTLVLAKRILEITGKQNLREVWPNLELFMHGGVSFDPYRQAFQELIPGPNMHYVETYNASEGFFGIQDQPHSEDLLLMLDYGIFYEFIPMDHYRGIDSVNTVDLSGVELHKNYAMVITTNGGLWRYIIGDTIRFTSLQPFRFRITGRTKSFLNAFGEEVIVDNAEKAVAFACSKTEAIVRDYTACPVFMNQNQRGAHEWLFEFIKTPNDMTRFAHLLDEHLRELNADYDAKRYRNMVLEDPVIQYLDPGTFDCWLKSIGKLGGQHKIPRLSNDRSIVEQVLKMSTKKQLS
jgi:hypothetical protein